MAGYTRNPTGLGVYTQVGSLNELDDGTPSLPNVSDVPINRHSTGTWAL